MESLAGLSPVECKAALIFTAPRHALLYLLPYEDFQTERLHFSRQTDCMSQYEARHNQPLSYIYA